MNNKDLCQCNQGRLPCTCKGGEPKAQYTAVDMATASADGFRDGAKSVVVELPPRIERTSQSMLQEDVADMTIWNRCWDQCKAAIIAAGGSVKE